MAICDETDIVIEDITKCTEHPLTLIVELMKCARESGKRYSVRVPHGSVPLNLLMEYARRYDVSLDVSSEGEYVRYVFTSKAARE
ncbi:MAG: hypothetical protein QXT69_05765 [Fervidicoccaceae archaeon]